MMAGRSLRCGREGPPSIKKSLWVAAGLFFIGLGVLGVFVPLLPTTPFLLLASACLVRGSARLHRWLLRHPLLGPPIRHYREERAVPRRVKAASLALLWGTILFSAFFVVGSFSLRLVLLAVATGVSIHILRLRTLRRP